MLINQIGATITALAIISSIHANIREMDTVALFAAFFIGAGLMLMTAK